MTRISSPHIVRQRSARNVMLWVAAATLPGWIALVICFGSGVLWQVLLSVIFAMLGEAFVLFLRRRPLRAGLGDCSALLTGLLLGLALPPLAPWWIACIGGLSATILGKQLYGGLGQNPFNPAMVAYALLLVSFPVQMSTLWATPTSVLASEAVAAPDLLHSVRIVAGSAEAVDAMTMATPLDVYKHEIAASTQAELRTQPVFGNWIATGWEWVNLAFLAGGLLLCGKRIITWHIPVSMLGALALCSLLLGWDPDRDTPLSLHLFAGGTMLGAFFIATDPVSAATSSRGKLWFGAGIGVLLYVIRTWGGYPDAIAFSVLLMNFAAPFLDYYTQPRAYGHRRPSRGIRHE